MKKTEVIGLSECFRCFSLFTLSRQAIYMPLSPSSLTWYRLKVGDALRLGRWPSGDALANVSQTLWFIFLQDQQAHVREMSTTRKLNFGPHFTLYSDITLW